MTARSCALTLAVASTVLMGVQPSAIAGDDAAADARRLLRDNQFDALWLLARRTALRGVDEDRAWHTVAQRLHHADRLEPHERVEEAAHVARDLGLHDLALERWEQFFRLMPSLRDRHRLRWASTDAVELERFADAAALLRQAGPETAPRAGMVDEYAASKRTLWDRIRFARDFWLSEGDDWRVSWAPRAAVRLLLPALEAPSTPTDADFELTYRAALLAFRDRDARRALALWSTRVAAADVVPHAMAVNSDLSSRHRRSAPEIDAVLLDVHPEAPVMPRETVAAALVMRERGDALKAERLLRGVLARVKGTQRPDADVRDLARDALAAILEESGRRAEARDLWLAWEGRGSDGAVGDRASQRALAIARSLAADGRADEAIETFLLPHYRAHALGPAMEGVNEALVDFHVALEAARGRMAALEAVLDALHDPDPAAVALARELIAMRRAAQRGEFESVIQSGLRLSERAALDQIIGSDDRMPAPLLRAALLMGAVPATIALAKTAFDREAVAPARGSPRRGALVALLRRHPVPAATAVLQVLSARADAGEALGVDRAVLAEALEHRLIQSN